jgi:hypothetical protein
VTYEDLASTSTALKMAALDVREVRKHNTSRCFTPELILSKLQTIFHPITLNKLASLALNEAGQPFFLFKDAQA